MSLLEQDTTKEERVDNALLELEKDLKFETEDSKKYEIETIINSMAYSQQANDQMSGLYYFVLWKGYLEEKNTWEPSSTVIYLRKLISTFHKEHSKKPIATFLSLDSVLLMARPLVLKEPKRKHGHPSKRTNKRDRK